MDNIYELFLRKFKNILKKLNIKKIKEYANN